MLDFDRPFEFETRAKLIDEFPVFGRGSLCAEHKGQKYRIYGAFVSSELSIPSEYCVRVRACLRTVLGQKQLFIEEILGGRGKVLES